MFVNALLTLHSSYMKFIFLPKLSPDEALDLVKDETSTPVLIICGDPTKARLRTYIVAEQKVVGDYTCGLFQSLVLAFVTYYIFNIHYPTKCQNTFVFIQKFLAQIKDNQKVLPKLIFLVQHL